MPSSANCTGGCTVRVDTVEDPCCFAALKKLAALRLDRHGCRFHSSLLRYLVKYQLSDFRCAGWRITHQSAICNLLEHNAKRKQPGHVSPRGSSTVHAMDPWILEPQTAGETRIFLESWPLSFLRAGPPKSRKKASESRTHPNLETNFAKLRAGPTCCSPTSCSSCARRDSRRGWSPYSTLASRRATWRWSRPSARAAMGAST